MTTETKMKPAGEVWHDWCTSVYRSRPKNRHINSPAGEDVFNLCFDFMRKKFHLLLISKYGVEKCDEYYIPNILIDPNDWKYGNDFWENIFIFLRYNLSVAEILSTLQLIDWTPHKTKEIKAYIQFRQGLKKLRKLHEREAKK